MSETRRPDQRAAAVAILGPDRFNGRVLDCVREPSRYAFRELLPASRVIPRPGMDVDSLIEDALSGLSRAGADAIVGWWDFPTSSLLPILRREHGLPGPSLEAVLRCEHKLWCRRTQRAVHPDRTPRFQAVDPFDERAAERIELDPPFWLKPVKSFQSMLGFRIEDEAQLHSALEEIREHIDLLARPFDAVLQRAQLPDDLRRLGGRACLAEELIDQGDQCTLEGYRLGGETRLLGVIDSVCEPGASTFDRYRYPSHVPPEIQEEMLAICDEMLGEAGFDGSVFNVEFYWDRDGGGAAPRLLEVNPRISQSHGRIFQLVDGAPNHEAMIEVALGRDPDFPQRKGRWPCAAKCFLRWHENGLVRSFPDEGDARRIEQEMDGVFLQLADLEPGARLSDLPFQEPYSYSLGSIHIGAEDDAGILSKRNECRERLGIEIEPVS